MRVGMELICAICASSGSFSVSTLPKVMSVWFCDALSYTGANCLHGPHQSAHQSTSVIPSAVTVSSKVSLLRCTVLTVLVLALGSISAFGRPNAHLSSLRPAPEWDPRIAIPCPDTSDERIGVKMVDRAGSEHGPTQVLIDHVRLGRRSDRRLRRYRGQCVHTHRHVQEPRT